MIKLIRSCVAVILLLAIHLNIASQGESNVWCFGKSAGIDFNGGMPLELGNGAID